MNFLIIGFFRSGTTYLSNILNSHPNAHTVVDPFISFLKTFRNRVLKKNKLKLYLKEKDLENFIVKSEYEKILLKYLSKKANFKEKISREDIDFFDKILKREKKYQHSNILKIKKNYKIKSFYELLTYYLNEFLKISNKKNKIKKIGTKISWCEEYIPVFKRSFKKLKIIFIIRDLKKSINSAENSLYLSHSAKRPMLYYILYWKKSVYFANKYKKYLLFIKYENLIKSKLKNYYKIFKYVGLKNIKIKKIYDQFGHEWKNNSSFNNRLKRKKIDPKISKLVNYFCYKELKLMKYNVKKINNYKLNEIIEDLKKIDNKTKFKKKYKYYLNYKTIINQLNY